MFSNRIRSIFGSRSTAVYVQSQVKRSWKIATFFAFFGRFLRVTRTFYSSSSHAIKVWHDTSRTNCPSSFSHCYFRQVSHICGPDSCTWATARYFKLAHSAHIVTTSNEVREDERGELTHTVFVWLMLFAVLIVMSFSCATSVDDDGDNDDNLYDFWVDKWAVEFRYWQFALLLTLHEFDGGLGVVVVCYLL